MLPSFWNIRCEASVDGVHTEETGYNFSTQFIIYWAPLSASTVWMLRSLLGESCALQLRIWSNILLHSPHISFYFHYPTRYHPLLCSKTVKPIYLSKPTLTLMGMEVSFSPLWAQGIMFYHLFSDSPYISPYIYLYHFILSFLP